LELAEEAKWYVGFLLRIFFIKKQN